MKIDDKVVFIEGENHGHYPYANSLLIKDEVTALIDAGIGKSIEELAKKERVDLIIHTHSHEDHIAGDGFFRSEIAIHSLEAPILEKVERLADLYGSKGEEMISFIRGFIGYKGLRVDHKFEDGYIFHLGDIQLKAVHTPGHSMGHTCFFENERKMLFSGDIDLSSFGPWYEALDSSIDDFISSIKRVKALRPKVVISSHKGVILDDIGDRFDVYLAKIYEREDKILGYLDSKRNLDSIVSQAFIYGKFPEVMRSWYVLMERIMVEKHLERLIWMGKVERTEDTFSAL